MNDAPAPIARSRYFNLVPILVGAALFSALLGAARGLAPGWDEGYVWQRIDILRPWVGRLFDPATPNRARLFSSDELDRHWRFAREEPDGHGPFYALLSYGGHAATSWLLPPPLSYRVGSILLYSIAGACVFGTLRSRWDGWYAGLTVALMTLLPRSVPEICYGLVDGPLLSLSLLVWCGFLRMESKPTWVSMLAFGVPLGLAMSTKLTGWFLPVPYVAWLLLWGNRRLWFAFAGGLLFALAATFIVNVGWWPHPIDAVRTFFESNLTRSKTRPIPNWFCGRKYDFSLPWYNTIVWVFVAVPPLVANFGMFGLLLSVIRCRRDSFGLLLSLNCALLLVVRAMPQAPGHDGTRQINIAFAFLAMLSVHGLISGLRQKTAKWCSACMVAISGLVVIDHHPLELSYYSPIVGELRGAAPYFEPTYFWDALTPDVLDWLAANTAHGRSVLFATNPVNWNYMRKWGLMRFENARPEIQNTHSPQWFVLQNRTGMLSPEERLLVEKWKPAHKKEFQGVLLIGVYSFEDYLEARREVASGAGGGQ